MPPLGTPQNQFFEWLKPGAPPASRDRVGKIKIREAKLKTSVVLDPNFHYSILRRIISEKQVISKKKKKKKVFAEIRRLFLAEITNLNDFYGHVQQLFLPKKTPWGARNKSGGAKRKIGRAMPPRWRRAWLKLGRLFF